jgi:hypothetical protein
MIESFVQGCCNSWDKPCYYDCWEKFQSWNNLVFVDRRYSCLGNNKVKERSIWGSQFQMDNSPIDLDECVPKSLKAVKKNFLLNSHLFVSSCVNSSLILGGICSVGLGRGVWDSSCSSGKMILSEANIASSRPFQNFLSLIYVSCCATAIWGVWLLVCSAHACCAHSTSKHGWSRWEPRLKWWFKWGTLYFTKETCPLSSL